MFKVEFRKDCKVCGNTITHMKKIEEAVEILMEEKGYTWCSECEEWIREIDESEMSHFLAKHG